jgi:hypothetical protein
LVRGVLLLARPDDVASGWKRASPLGALLPVLGMAVIAAFIPYCWLPIRGEIARATPRRDGGH